MRSVIIFYHNHLKLGRQTKKSEETENTEIGNATPEITQLPEEIDFRESLGGKYSAP